MYTLRTYQQNAVDEAIKFVNNKQNKKKPVIVAPTGAGKSLYIAAIADKLDFPLIVLQPSKELLLQNYEKYTNYGNKASIFSASLGSKEIGHVTFATIGSIKNNAERFKELGVKLILIDEAHLQSRPNGQINKFLKQLGNVKLLGLTATPIVLNNTLNGPMLQMVNRTRKSIWNDILFVTQIKEVIEQGFWADLQYKTIELDEDDLQFNASKSEFTESSMQRVYEKNNVDQLILEEIKAYKDVKKHILIFCPTVEVAKNLQTKIEGSAVIYGNMNNKERDVIITKFKNGEIQVVINVFVLSIGFDFPGLDMIIDTSPTASIGRYYQKLGRVVRPFEDKQGLIVDLAGNVNRFGELKHLVFEEHPTLGWNMFSKDVLLTNIPVSEIGKIRKPTLEQISEEQRNKLNPVIDFGKHKGKRIKEIPTNYLSWILKEFQWNNYNKDLKTAIENLLK